MADVDFEKLAGSFANVLGNQVHTWIAILLRPREAFRDLAVGIEKGSQPLYRAVGFGLVSTAVGLCVGKLVQLRGTPSPTAPETLVGITFILILLGLFIHLVVWFFGGKASPLGTIALSIYAICSLQLIWIPLTGFASQALFKTHVTLTYGYVIAGGGETRGINEEWFIKEDEPLRNATIIPPQTNGIPVGIYIGSAEEQPRVQFAKSGLPAPLRSERFQPTTVAVAFLFAYLSTILIYLSLAIAIHFQIPAISVVALVPAVIFFIGLFGLIFVLAPIWRQMYAASTLCYAVISVLCLVAAISLTWHLGLDRSFPSRDWRGLLLWSGSACGMGSIIVYLALGGWDVVSRLKMLLTGMGRDIVPFELGLAMVPFILIMPFMIVGQAVWMRFGWRAKFFARFALGGYIGSIVPGIFAGGIIALLSLHYGKYLLFLGFSFIAGSILSIWFLPGFKQRSSSEVSPAPGAVEPD